MHPDRRSLRPLPFLLAAYVLLRYWRARYGDFFEYDEYFYFHWARFTWTEVIQAMRVDVWPPLPGLLFKPVIQLAEYSPALPRCLAIAFGAMSMAYLYVFANARFGARAAMCAAGLLLVSPLDVTWTTLARGYSLFMLAMTVLTIHAWHALERRAALDWVLIVICSIVLLYTHFLSALILFSLWLLLGGCFTLRRDWASLGLLFLAGVALIFAFLPYVPTFLNQLECGANMKLDAFYPQRSVGEFVLMALDAQAGGRAALALLATLAVLGTATAKGPFDPQARRWIQLAVGVFVLASLMSFLYHTFKRPMFNPGKQAIMFHGPLMLALGLCLSRIRFRHAVTVALCLLLANTCRIVHSALDRLPARGRDAAVVRELTGALDNRAHLYFGNLTRIHTFIDLARTQSPDLLIRDFSNFRADYIPTVLPEFVYRDLASAPVAIWLNADEAPAALTTWLREAPMLRNCELRVLPIAGVPGSELWILTLAE